MRKLKSFKEVSLIRYGYIPIGDRELPIKTAGIKKANISTMKLAKMYKIPSKSRSATEEEKENLRASGHQWGAGVPLVVEFDTTSETYIKMMEEKSENQIFLDIAIHVDLDYELENGKKLWQDLNLVNSEDYFGLSKWLGDLGLDESDYKLAIGYIGLIKIQGAKSYDEVIEKEVENDTASNKEKRTELISE